MIKFSRQRESIKNNLMGRTDHPTAETVYSDIRQEYPNISLGTVYRNLSLLADLGEIQKISTENGPDRFDGNPKPHYHFFCTNCNSVLDLKMKNIDLINVIAAEEFAGLIEGHITRFYGLCPECKKLLDKSGSLPDKSTNPCISHMIRTVGHSFIADDPHKSCRTLDQKRSKQNLQKRSRTHRQKQ